MKKIVLVLAVLILATPAMAAVTIKVTQWLGGPGFDVEGVVRYEVTGGDANLIRAFALDFEFDSSGCTDKNDVSLVTVTPGSEDPNYWVYPGSIDVNAATGVIDNYGSMICDPCYPGTLSLADDNGITIEMASLYSPLGAGSPNRPDPCGILFKFTLDKTSCVDVKGNVIRGGVVMEDGTTPALTFTGSKILIAPGDICGSGAGPKDGKCNLNDYLQMLANWKGLYSDQRTDLASSAGWGIPDGKCNLNDYNVLLNYWKQNRSCGACP